MEEFKELRFYMLLIGIFACLLKIGMIFWPYLERSPQCIAVKNAVLLWLNC